MLLVIMLTLIIGILIGLFIGIIFSAGVIAKRVPQEDRHLLDKDTWHLSDKQ